MCIFEPQRRRVWQQFQSLSGSPKSAYLQHKQGIVDSQMSAIVICYFLYSPGLYEFRNSSIKPSDIRNNTNVILLIITRWNSFDLRNSLRIMLTNHKRTSLTYKTVFLFNYDGSASKKEIERICDENKKYRGMQMKNVEVCR